MQKKVSLASTRWLRVKYDGIGALLPNHLGFVYVRRAKKQVFP